MAGLVSEERCHGQESLRGECEECVLVEPGRKDRAVDLKWSEHILRWFGIAHSPSKDSVFRPLPATKLSSGCNLWRVLKSTTVATRTLRNGL
ncbi:uncharacterized protein J3R85_013431 [Psidium guajava]|nr:uncharacterized protein J3R85_013431 [Psidium guajava]